VRWSILKIVWNRKNGCWVFEKLKVMESSKNYAKERSGKKTHAGLSFGASFYRTILPLSYHETGQLLNGQNRSFLPEFGSNSNNIGTALNCSSSPLLEIRLR
jgi:hypothetical protein